ncbi:MAG: ABC transporter permease [Actinomycetota bacterium]
MSSEVATGTAVPARNGNITLALRQIRFENKSFWRNPAAAFFTFAFPLIFLVLFNLLFGDTKYHLGGEVVTLRTFYVPAIAAFSVITACYTNVAMSLTFSREQGVLKRKRGTPLPAWGYLAGKIAHSVLIAFLLVAIVTAAGYLFYDVHLSTSTLPAFIVTVFVGSLTFPALGVAMTSFVPNADAAPAVINATILPLLFISGIFIPLNNIPTWLLHVSNFFPIHHFAEAMSSSFTGLGSGNGFRWGDLGIMGVWAIVGAILALRFFKWEKNR